MQRFEKKLNDLLDGQIQQRIEVQILKTSMEGNGLAREIRDTKICIESLDAKFTKVCEIYNEKFDEFDDFHWFRVWANGLKDKTVVWGLTFAFIGGAIVSVIGVAAYAILKLLEKI